MVNMVMLGLKVELDVLEVFSNLSDFYDSNIPKI